MLVQDLSKVTFCLFVGFAASETLKPRGTTTHWILLFILFKQRCLLSFKISCNYVIRLIKLLMRRRAAFGGLAHMVERSLCMREVPGSIPGFSNLFMTTSKLEVLRQLRNFKQGMKRKPHVAVLI